MYEENLGEIKGFPNSKATILHHTPLNIRIGTISFIAKRWSLGLKWIWRGLYYGRSIGKVTPSAIT